jgi:hypothetical protein
MLLYTDKDGRYIGHLDQGYPALPEVLEKVSADLGGNVYDIPPLVPEFWYFPEGVPTIRPILDYTVTETQEGGDRVTVISGIPAGVTVTIAGPEGNQSWEADGDELELVLRTAGDYSVSFDPFPDQPVAVHISVTEKGA